MCDVELNLVNFDISEMTGTISKYQKDKKNEQRE